MWRLSDAELNCVRTKMRRMSACRQLLIGMSIEPVFAADRHRGLRAMVRQRKESRALAAAENDREHFVVHRHGGESYSPLWPAILAADVRKRSSAEGVRPARCRSDAG